MTTRLPRLNVTLIAALLVVIVAMSGADLPGVFAQSDREDEDADMPPFARSVIDKEDYVRLRAAHVDLLRGLPYKDAARLRAAAIKQAQEQERVAWPLIDNQNWIPLGPSPIPNGQATPSTSASGRVIAIAVHPANPNIVYAGTAQGGVYRTLDGGATWRAIFDGAQSLAVGAIAISPSSPSTVFVGTGEPNFSCDSFAGVGVYRIDYADTAPKLSGPFNKNGGGGDVMTGRAISKIVVHPTDPNIIFVATTTGIGGVGCDLPPAQPDRGLYRSTNAMSDAATFAKLSVATAAGGNRSVVDVVMEPGNPGNIICAVAGFNAAGDGGIYRSTNALDAQPTFANTLALGTASATVRAELAINKSGAAVTVYAASGEASGAARCGTNGTLRKSTDGGQTWSPPLAAGSGFCGGQCSYNIALAVDPADPARIILGGNLAGTCTKLAARSTDGGATFLETSAGVHADNHVAVFAPSDPSVVYMGTDGGIYKSTSGGLNWESINNAGFNATQFQSIALHPDDREFFIGGTQDNGTELRRSDGTWTRADFGDGGFALIDQNATGTTNLTMYHTYFNAAGAMGIARMSNGATIIEGNWVLLGCGFAGAAPNGLKCTDAAVLFYAPIALGPGNPNTLYFGSDRLYRSDNEGSSMVEVSQQFPMVATNSDRAVSAIGVSPQNDNVRLVGLKNGKLFATTTGATQMNDVTGTVPARYVARAVIDPRNSNKAYVTLGGYGLAAGQHVWKTTNLNAAAPVWSPIGNGLPDVPVNAFAVDPTDSNQLYAGTDIGVFRSTDGGGIWLPMGAGLPRVAVFDLAIQNNHRLLRAATHGRGVWEISISRFNLSGNSASFAANGGAGEVTVTGPASLTWTAATSDSWITVVSPTGAATGNGTVSFTVAPNLSATSNRVGKITIANQTFTVCQGAAFLDVAMGSTFYNDIGKLSARGVTLGDGAGHFNPDSPVTRGQMAAFIIRALGDTSPYTPAWQRFNDVQPSNAFYNFIEQMAVRQITLGCDDARNYCPDSPVLRDQMAAFIVRALGETNPPEPDSQRFADVPESNTFYRFVDRLAALQITSGCDLAGNYCPGDRVSRGAMAKFLVRAFGL